MIGVLTEKARAMCLAANLSNMWHFAMQTACYTRNRLPTNGNKDNLSPFQLWSKRAPKVSHLQAWGTTCYVLLDQRQRPRGDKFSPKAVEATFLGYPSNSPGYLVRMPNGNVLRRVHVSFKPLGVDDPTDDDDAPDDNAEHAHSTSCDTNDDDTVTDDCTGQQQSPPDGKPDIEQPDESEHRCNGHWCCTAAGAAAYSLFEHAFEEFCFTASEASGVTTPKTVKQALSSEQSPQWEQSMMSEFKSMIENNVWEVVPRSSVPKGRRIITSTWNFKVKQNPQGEITRYKSRLCARGFQQIPGQDFNRTHAPTARLDSFRGLAAKAAQRDYDLHHCDFHTAYLNGELEEEIYMEIPDGFDMLVNAGLAELPPGLQLKDCVLLLKKSIYGLKQAGRNWNRKLHAEFHQTGICTNGC